MAAGAWERLHDALNAAFGGLPADVATEPLVIRGEASRVLVGTAGRAGDLLVIGTGRHGSVGRLAGVTSAGTAWPALAARCWPSLPPCWSSQPGTACEAGHSGTSS